MPHKLASVELSRLLNSAVKNCEGEVLGYIHDIVLNPHNGRIEYVRLALVTDEVDTESSSIAVPWSQFKLVNIAADIELDISPEVLRVCAKGPEGTN
ncbi:PRC-barrel domain-containing protein [uncultured Marinobacter sp.]|uniref:PRC-barrel domain-containing protein n=1 Tax=uncultured Marinobacter sp. TaxID=187379 RepID=UPI0030D97E76|tara:strand:+ start:287 stop:577 length:291 start_codon:yes stop_codon:yes gene_type:complete